MNRRGLVLIAVLWVIVLAGTLALAATLTARESVAVARNRIALARSLWTAEGCIAAARLVVDSAMSDPAAWRAMDRVVGGRSLPGCSVQIEPAGVRLDLNAASPEQLARLLEAAGVNGSAGDSLVDALLDWRDEDDVPRPLGAERPWYLERRRFPPRDAPLADMAELARVRGFDRHPALARLLDVEPGRIAVNHAPPEVLAAIPGAGPALLARLAELRARDELVSDLGALVSRMHGEARDSALARFGELVAAATTSPDSWILNVTAPDGGGQPQVVIELRLVPAGSRAAVVRRRGG